MMERNIVFCFTGVIGSGVVIIIYGSEKAIYYTFSSYFEIDCYVDCRYDELSSRSPKDRSFY